MSICRSVNNNSVGLDSDIIPMMSECVLERFHPGKHLDKHARGWYRCLIEHKNAECLLVGGHEDECALYRIRDIRTEANKAQRKALDEIEGRTEGGKDVNVCNEKGCVKTAKHLKPHTDKTGYSWDSETSPPKKKTKGDILEIANAAIHGEKREAYGTAKESFSRIARKWSVTLGVEITPEQVAICMIDFKTCRELNKHGEDNLVDICGYAALIQELQE